MLNRGVCSAECRLLHSYTKLWEENLGTWAGIHLMGGLLNTSFTVSVYLNVFRKSKSLAKWFCFGFRDTEDKHLIIFFPISTFWIFEVFTAKESIRAVLQEWSQHRLEQAVSSFKGYLLISLFVPNPVHSAFKVIPQYCIAHLYCARFLRH